MLVQWSRSDLPRGCISRKKSKDHILQTSFQPDAQIHDFHGSKWYIDLFCRCSQYAEGVILSLESMWEESNVRTPMICFLSMGSDPTASIEALAKKMRLGKHSVYLCTTLSSVHSYYQDWKQEIRFKFIEAGRRQLVKRKNIWTQ